jgi:hypothetical protein
MGFINIIFILGPFFDVVHMKQTLVLNVAIKWLTFLLRIRETSGSILDPYVSYPDKNLVMTHGPYRQLLG